MSMITGNNIERFGIAQQASMLKLHKAGMKMSTGSALANVKRFLGSRGYECGRSFKATAQQLQNYCIDNSVSNYPFTQEQAQEMHNDIIIDITLDILNLDSLKIESKEVHAEISAEQMSITADGGVLGIYDVARQ